MLPVTGAGALADKLSARSILLEAAVAGLDAATDALEVETLLLALVFAAAGLVLAGVAFEEADFTLPSLAVAVFESAFTESVGFVVECAGECVAGWAGECIGDG